MARRFTRPRIAAGPRRQTNWIGSADQGLTTIAAGAKQLNQSFAPDGGAGVVAAPLTITRTVGQITATTVANPGADGQVIGAVGFCVVTDLAIAAGAGSIPGPITNQDWDGWFVHRFFFVNYEVETVVGTLMLGATVEFDSKAQRKILDQAYGVAVMVENSGAISIRVLPQFRMLMKLH